MRRSRGASLLIPVVVFVTAAAFAVVVAASLSGGDIYASDANADSIQALYLAETGVERALKRFATGVACNALGEPAITDLSTIGLGSTAYDIVISNGVATDFSNVALPASQCRVAVTGRVIASNVRRTLHAILDINLLEGPDNAGFDNPPVAANTASGWTANGAQPARTFADAGGPSCSRSAWLAREAGGGGGGNNRRSSFTAAVAATIVSGSQTTVRFHRRVITRGAGCPATVTGPALPAACGAALQSTVCFQILGPAGAVIGTIASNANAVAGPMIAACPTTFVPCGTSYNGFPPSATKITLGPFALAAGTSITGVRYWLSHQGAGQREIYIDDIEVTNLTAVGVARVQVWRDCSTASCP